MVRIAIISATGTHPLNVELAQTEAERARGLMGRATLGENAGMLFVYPEPQSPNAGFWMYRTRMPLDIAFLDGQRNIVALRTMTPCAGPAPERCPSYLPHVAYQFALEVNAGYFERRGIAIGDRLQCADP